MGKRKTAYDGDYSSDKSISPEKRRLIGDDRELADTDAVDSDINNEIGNDFEFADTDGDDDDSDNQEAVVKDVADNVQMCTTLAVDIYEYLHSLEVKPNRRPMPDYIEKIQKDISATMRSILVDWLVEVTEEYKLLPDTLYLTVSYLDRYLSTKEINQNRLQLLGVSCMLIASKFEEIRPPPRVSDFTCIADDIFTNEAVVEMEQDILHLLNFEIGGPTALGFLRRLTGTAQGNCQSPNLQLKFLGCYLAELSLLDYACVRFLPSMVAASEVFLANFTIEPNKPPWNPTLQKESTYSPSDLKNCVSAIHDLHLNRKEISFVAIRNKYKHQKCVAELKCPSEIRDEYFEDVAHDHSSRENTNTFFQEPLELLRRGFDSELCRVADSRLMYMTAAKLCKSIAEKYKKCNEMAATALAYKCMEAAYTRVWCSVPRKDIKELRNQKTHRESDLHKKERANVTKPEEVPSFIELTKMTNDSEAKWKQAYAMAMEYIGESEASLHVKHALECPSMDINVLVDLIQLAIQALKIV